MSEFSSGQIIPVLQVAVIPVILVSGVGLLLLTFTNRFGRVSDRLRLLATEARQASEQDLERIQPQLGMLYRRAAYLRAAITFASVSVLLGAVLVITLFGAALLALEVAPLIGLLFMGSMVALAASMVAFMLDLNRSLLALRLELSSLSPGSREWPRLKSVKAAPVAGGSQ